jgi:hypothetical protein
LYTAYIVATFLSRLSCSFWSLDPSLAHVLHLSLWVFRTAQREKGDRETPRDRDRPTDRQPDRQNCECGSEEQHLMRSVTVNRKVQ